MNGEIEYCNVISIRQGGDVLTEGLGTMKYWPSKEELEVIARSTEETRSMRIETAFMTGISFLMSVYGISLLREQNNLTAWIVVICFVGAFVWSLFLWFLYVKVLMMRGKSS